MFIILGVVILAVFGTVFFLKEYSAKNDQKNYNLLSEEIDGVSSYVKDCIQTVSEDGLIIIGSTGGYYEMENVHNYFGVAYFYNNGDTYIPTQETLKNQISIYIERNLKLCTNEYFQNQTYEINDQNPKVDITINEDSILLNTNYEIEITKNKVSYTLKEFNNKLKVRLGTIENTYNEIIETSIDHSAGICITCINEIVGENNLYIELTNLEENNMEFLIIDLNSTIKNEEYYEFRFIIKNE